MSLNDAPSAARPLIDALGPGRVVASPGQLRLLSGDMGTPPRLFEQLLRNQPPLFAVRPQSTSELSTAMGLLARHGVACTPRGLGSSGLGGAVPVAEGAVLDLSQLAGVLGLDLESRQVRVTAGTSFYHLQRALDPHGLALQSRPSNAFGTVGGWAACGGLGLGSLRAGPVVEQVRSMVVVLPDGSREQLGPGDAGFADFFDTEGQLGVIAELCLQLRSADRGAPVVGLSFPDLGAALGYLDGFVAREGRPHTALLVGRGEEQHGLSCDAGRELLLLEVGSGRAPDAGDHGGERLSPGLAAQLWRRRFFPMDGPLGPVFLASESLLELGKVAAYVARARGLAGRYGVPLHVHCHAAHLGGEPRMLVLIIFPCDPSRTWHHLLLTPLAAVLTARARKAGGVPYGVGIWNTPFARTRFGERFDQLKERKRALDPQGLLNPGKFFRVGVEARALPTLMSPGLYPASLGAAALATPWVLPEGDPHADGATTAERCIRCGACVPICPAVVATGDETLSARAKLGLLHRLRSGEELDLAELEASLRCLDCGQCAEVCARSLDLLGAWQELEQAVRGRCTAPQTLAELIGSFADQVDQQADRVLERGLD